MGENYLVEPLSKAPDDGRVALGIHQSDVILRTAIIAGLADIRANPDLLDYVFASLPKDDLTFQEYGEQQVNAAKEWFLSQDIPVFMNTRVDAAKVPCITIATASSSEGQATLGDVHYQTVEASRDDKTIVYGKIQLKSYNPTTGVAVMPTDVDLEVFAGMMVQTATGAKYAISDVIDPWTFVIDKGIVESLSTVTIISAHKKAVTLESLDFREVFEIGCHVHSEPIYLTYLWSVLIFILLRYKEELIEARGLERTTVQASGVVLNSSFGTTQLVFTRMTTVTGFVRQYWPKFTRTPIEGLTGKIGTSGNINGWIRPIDDNSGTAVPIFTDDDGT